MGNSELYNQNPCKLLSKGTIPIDNKILNSASTFGNKISKDSIFQTQVNKKNK